MRISKMSQVFLSSSTTIVVCVNTLLEEWNGLNETSDSQDCSPKGKETWGGGVQLIINYLYNMKIVKDINSRKRESQAIVSIIGVTA